MEFGNNSISFDSVLKNPITFGVATKCLPTKGNLVYEYNPFRNYRLNGTAYYYKNRLFTPKELLDELGVKVDSDEAALAYLKGRTDWGDLIP
jgi:hypothetical protein